MRVITTSSVKTNEALYHLMRIAGLYMVASLADDPDLSIKTLISAMPNIKPLLKPLGMTAADVNQFVKQMRFWLGGDLDWDNNTHSRRFESAVETYFLYIQEVLVDMDEAELDDQQKALRSSFEPSEHALLKAMLGYILNLSRRYTTQKFTDATLKACAVVFREDKEVYWEYIHESEELANEGYEKPADYKLQRDALRAIIERNGVETCEGDDFLATFKGLAKLQKDNAEEAKQYSKIRTFLNREAYRAVLGDILYDNMGEPQRWSNIYTRLTRGSNDIYIPLNKMPNGAWTGMVQVIKNAKGEDSLQYLSPYGEVLKQNTPCGNILMNPKYIQGSLEFVATYVIPSSQAQTRVYVYTLEADRAKKAERFDQTRNVIANLDTYRAKWLKDLKAFDTQMKKYYDSFLKPKSRAKPPTAEQWRNGILAMICEIGYQAAPRTGEKGTSSLDTNGSRTPTYALTTLKIGHLVTDPVECNPAIWGSKEDDGTYSYPSSDIKKVAFKYKGKAAEPQYHEFLTTNNSDGDGESRVLLNNILTKYIANLARAYADMGINAKSEIEIKREQLFRIPNVRAGKEAPVNEWSIVLNRHVNDYLKKRVKFDGTFKMFRKLKATKEFMDYMESVKSTLDASNIESHILHAAGLAGKALGHAAAKRKATGTMALQYYIEVRTVLDYYTLVNVNPSKRVANLIKDNIADNKA